jgi:hypothetical protein
MTDLIPHQLKLTEAQMKKLLSGLTAKIPHKYLGAEKGEQIIHLAKDNAEKLMNAYRGGAVASLKMTSPEIRHTAKNGSGFDLEKILNSPVGQKIAEKLVDKAISKLGGKTGGALSFEKIMSSPIVQKIGDKLIDKAVDRAFAGEGVRPKKGSEEMRERMAKLRAMKGKKGGDLHSGLLDIQKGLHYAGMPFERSVGVNPADLGQIIGEEIGKSLSGGRGKMHVGKGVKQSSAYKKAMKSQVGFVPDVPAVKNAPASSFGVDKRVKPSGDQMTLSPYQAPSAPAMNPFVPKFYTQEGGQSCGYGGRGLYAGKGLY